MDTTYIANEPPLPAGVTVHTRADGYLEVVGIFKSRRKQILKEVRLTRADLNQASDAIKAWLNGPKRKEVARVQCSYRTLQDAVFAASVEVKCQVEQEEEIAEELRSA